MAIGKMEGALVSDCILAMDPDLDCHPVDKKNKPLSG